MTVEADEEALAAAGLGDGRIGVVIVSWNVRSLLLKCLETVVASDRVDARDVVVVDNGSADGSPHAVRQHFPRVRLIERPDNPGFAVANNVGFRALGLRIDGTGRPSTAAVPPAGGAATVRRHRGSKRRRSSGAGEPVFRSDRRSSAAQPAEDAPPFVLILNPDTELNDGALDTLFDHLLAHPEAGAVGPLLRYGDGSIQGSRRRFPTLAVALTESTPVEWHWPDHRLAEHFRMADVPATCPQAVDWLNGAAILFRTPALETVGGFDEDFFMYAEETDLCRRIHDAGWTIRFEPRAEVIHYEGRSSEQDWGARHVRFVRSRVYYMQKHYGVAAAMLLRCGLAFQFTSEMILEGAKWLAGHKRSLRRERIRAYRAVMGALLR